MRCCCEEVTGGFAITLLLMIIKRTICVEKKTNKKTLACFLLALRMGWNFICQCWTSSHVRIDECAIKTHKEYCFYVFKCKKEKNGWKWYSGTPSGLESTPTSVWTRVHEDGWEVYSPVYRLTKNAQMNLNANTMLTSEGTVLKVSFSSCFENNSFHYWI